VKNEPTPTSPQSPRRRSILGIAGIGAATTITAALGWRMANERDFELSRTGMKTPVSPEIAASDSVNELPPTLPEREAFIPHLRSEFQIREATGVARSATLVEVSAVEVVKGHLGSFSGYSLMFEGPAGFLSDAGICVVEHSELGKMEFFLTPVGKPGAKSFLQAVFSQKMA